MADDQKPAAKPHRPQPTLKTFDIFKPGKGKPQPTSRPVILGHKPSAPDSTLTGHHPLSQMPARHLGHTLMGTHSKVSVKPPAFADASSQPAPAPKFAISPVAAATPEPPFEGADSTPSTAADEQTPSSQTPTSPTLAEPQHEPAVAPVVPNHDAPPTTPAADSPQPAAESSVSNAQSVPVQFAQPVPDVGDDRDASQDEVSTTSGPAFDPSKIVVSHHAGRGLFMRRLVWTLLILIVVAAAADAVLDAGIWKPSANIPHTHFIQR